MFYNTSKMPVHPNERLLPPKTDLSVPPVAWPTLAVTAAIIFTWTACFVLGHRETVSLWLLIPISSYCAFAAFTPMHDSAHGSVARLRWLNNLVGRLTAPLLMGPFGVFRFMHLEHHKYTNEPGKDPDLWSGEPPYALLPLRWFTQELHYYWWYFSLWNKRPTAERLDFTLSTIALVGVMLGLTQAGYGRAVLLLWIVPALVAAFFLAFSFDFLPHQPHLIPQKSDRYRATHLLIDPWLTPLFLYQNLHLIHHLYPGIPFYRYARIWRSQRAFLRSQGAREISLFS
jgi:beta-carotene hydroxylase